MTFARVCRGQSIANIWILRLSAVTNKREDSIVYECIYPETPAEKDRFIGRSLAEINADKSVLHTHLPYQLASGHVLHESDICIVAAPTCPLDPKTVIWIIKHMLSVLSSLAAQGMHEWPDHYTRKLLSSPSFRKRGADNFLIIDTMDLCRKLGRATAVTFWRLSRTRQTLDAVAKYDSSDVEPSPLVSEGVGSIPIDDFYQVFASNQGNVAPRQTVSDCVIVSTDPHEAPQIRFIVRTLSNNTLQTPSKKQGGATLRFRVATPKLPDGQMATAYFPVNHQPFRQKSMIRLAASLLTGTEIAPTHAALIIPFFAAKTIDRVELNKLRNLLRKDPTQSSNLPFVGCVVMVVPKSELTTHRIELIKQILDRVAHLLDIYSHQRLQFRHFSNVIESVITCKDDLSLLTSCELAAKQMFGAKGMIAWRAPATGNTLIYKSRDFHDVYINEPEARKFGSTLQSEGWFRYRHLDDVPRFLQASLSTALDNRDAQINTGKKAGISGYSFPLHTSAGSIIIAVLRDRPVRPSTWEQSTLKALRLLLQLQASQIASASLENARLPNEALQTYDPALVRPTDNLQAASIFSYLEELENINGFVGYLFFSLDSDAEHLCLERATHCKQDTIEIGSHLLADRQTLASLSIERRQALYGQRRKRYIDVYRDGDSNAVEVVPFLGWIPGASTFVCQPIVFDEDTSFVMVVGFKRQAIRCVQEAIIPTVRRIAQSMLTALSFSRALERVSLRDETVEAERMISELPAPIVDVAESSNDLPPDVSVVFQPDFCRAISTLFEKYATHFDWLSISLRVANWFETELCRVAGTGPVGFQTWHSLASTDSTITYCYKQGAMHEAISIPALNMLRSLQSTYPNLRYKPSRSGVKSELCFTLRNRQGKTIGTLNFESKHERAFSNSRWACARLRSDIEHIVGSRMSQQHHALMSVVYGMRSYVGFIYHELKNVADPVLSEINRVLKSRPEVSGLSEEIASMTFRQQTAFKAKISGMSFAKDAAFSLRKEVDSICEELRKRYEAEMSTWRIQSTTEHFGQDRLVISNIAILRMIVDSLLRDIMLRHIRLMRHDVHIKVITLQSETSWSIHIAQNHGALMQSLAKRLFWYPRPGARVLTGITDASVASDKQAFGKEDSLDTGVGAYYHGLFLRGLGLYPMASRSIPQVFAEKHRDNLGQYRCWFSIYGRTRND